VSIFSKNAELSIFERWIPPLWNIRKKASFLLEKTSKYETYLIIAVLTEFFSKFQKAIL